MIRFLLNENGHLKELEQPEASCWINISPPFVQEELVQLSDNLGIPIDFLLDPLDVDERSRYEKEEDIKLIVVSTAVLNKSEGDNDAMYITMPIGIILTADNIITITSSINPVLRLFLEGKVKNFDPADREGFVLQILEQNVYRFLTCLKKLNNSRNLVEKELYNSSRNQDLRRLLNIEKSLVYFVNSLSSNELLKMKMKRSDFLGIRDDEDKTDLFEDIIIDNSQALEMANVYTNILNGTMEAYASIISNNLNVVIQGLTLVTIIISVPTLIASLFGMNVILPFKSDGNPYMFFYIVFFSLVVSLLLALWFRRKRLL
jgi:magnesium transporter